MPVCTHFRKFSCSLLTASACCVAQVPAAAAATPVLEVTAARPVPVAAAAEAVLDGTVPQLLLAAEIAAAAELTLGGILAQSAPAVVSAQLELLPHADRDGLEVICADFYFTQAPPSPHPSQSQFR